MYPYTKMESNELCCGLRGHSSTRERKLWGNVQEPQDMARKRLKGQAWFAVEGQYTLWKQQLIFTSRHMAMQMNILQVFSNTYLMNFIPIYQNGNSQSIELPESIYVTLKPYILRFLDTREQNMPLKHLTKKITENLPQAGKVRITCQEEILSEQTRNKTPAYETRGLPTTPTKYFRSICSAIHTTCVPCVNKVTSQENSNMKQRSQ
jgi:hypothetical protein